MHLNHRIGAALFAVILVIGIVTLVLPAQGVRAATTGGAAISVSAGGAAGVAASVGATVTLAGQGFSGGENITVKLNGQAIATAPGTAATVGDGTFVATFVVPSALQPLSYPLVAQGQSSGAIASLVFWVKAGTENIQTPTSGNQTFQITNTGAREPAMSYLRITNSGDANLVNPKITVDSASAQDPWTDMSSLSAIVSSILARSPNAMTDAQKTLALWQWLTDYMYHQYDAQNPNIQDQPDVIGLLNNYGYTRCFNHSRILSDLFQTAGYQARTWNLNGHAVAEVFYGNAWHMYDADEEKYFIGADGTVLSVQDIINNPYYVFEDTNPAGLAYHYTAPYYANLYATTGDNQSLGNVFPPTSHDMGITLRKGETLSQNWTNVGKYHDNYLHGGSPPAYTNGDIVYTPNLAQAGYANGMLSQTNVAAVSQDGLTPNLHSQFAGTASSVVYQVTSPYTLVGSLFTAQTYRATANDAVSIYFSLDGMNWGNPIYTQTKTGYDAPQLDLSTLLNDGTLPEEYKYYLKFAWTGNSAANGAGINSFMLDSQFEQAVDAPPPLHSGVTNVTYTDQSGTAHAAGDVQVAYGWQKLPDAANYSKSSLTTDATSIPANGSTFANITLTLKDSSSKKMANTIVQLVTSAPVQIQATYSNQSLRGQTDGNGQATFEVRATQVGPVTLTAADKNGTPLPGIAPVTLNFTTPPALPTLSISEGATMVNGGFETGTLLGWATGGAITPTVTNTTAAAGAYAASLGAAATTGVPTDSSLVETLTLPAKTKSLSFAYQLRNPDNDAGNYLEVWVRDTAGDKLYQLFTMSANSSGWQTLTLTYLNKYSGNTIQIYFNLHQDGSSHSAQAYLDNVQNG